MKLWLFFGPLLAILLLVFLRKMRGSRSVIETGTKQFFAQVQGKAMKILTGQVARSAHQGRTWHRLKRLVFVFIARRLRQILTRKGKEENVRMALAEANAAMAPTIAEAQTERAIADIARQLQLDEMEAQVDGQQIINKQRIADAKADSKLERTIAWANLWRQLFDLYDRVFANMIRLCSWLKTQLLVRHHESDDVRDAKKTRRERRNAAVAAAHDRDESWSKIFWDLRCPGWIKGIANFIRQIEPPEGISRGTLWRTVLFALFFVSATVLMYWYLKTGLVILTILAITGAFVYAHDRDEVNPKLKRVWAFIGGSKNEKKKEKSKRKELFISTFTAWTLYIVCACVAAAATWCYQLSWKWFCIVFGLLLPLLVWITIRNWGLAEDEDEKDRPRKPKIRWALVFAAILLLASIIVGDIVSQTANPEPKPKTLLEKQIDKQKGGSTH